ncbi:AP2-associated protein kinase 1 [Bactrocera neohumeralis]|uniref:AP2-associated protein kinase 1 n=1 Tax=Bactrocera neohumeralis TaxID=98809 RepID=UPI002165D3CA|nr:AP2-associated protein kinase 1 [Bactrocera neohumeralis]
MSCINYPSNYRVIMETPISTISNQPTTAEQPLTPVQCSCQRTFQQPNQHHQSAYPPPQPPQPPQSTPQPPHATPQQQQIQQLHQQQKSSLQQQQQQQQQIQLYQQQQQQLQQFVNCLNQQPVEQASASKSSQQDSQNSQASTVTTAGLFSKAYCIRSTSESGGQLSCRCPFEISISSAHPPARPSYEIRLPSGMASSNYSGRNNLSEEEFYSLSSASSDRDDCMPSAAVKGKAKSGSKTKNRFADCECSPSTQENKTKASANANANPPRNVAILQLLREVVQLINQGDENGTGCGCGVATTKMRNIGALGSEESMADNGPFNSGFKITFTPSRKGTSPNQSIAHSEMSEPQPVGQPVNIPLQLPCNLIITPNLLTCAPCSPCVPLSNVAIPPPQKMQITAGSEAPTKSLKKVKVGEKNAEGYCGTKGMPCSCIGDLELIEEIATLALAADPKNRTEPSSQPCEEDSRYGAGATFDISPIVCGKGCPEECTCKQPCLCPVHGFYQPTAMPDDEECECIDADDTGIVTEPSQSQTHVSAAPSATASQRTNQTNKTKSDCTECSCCHCQAMRDKQNCSTIATQNQAKDQCSCSELRFFIDSIIMDLDAMEQARRKKNAEQNTTPTRGRICPRQSFPVTITEVSDLGISSLYVKWVIHDCCGIGGYEIYVDGYLTNRYFHCNHEAAVICDVDVTKAHKIVLVAQPKQSDCSCGDNMENKCKELMRKGDADKMDKANVPPSALWVPSIYLYDPCEKREGTPINRHNL